MWKLCGVAIVIAASVRAATAAPLPPAVDAMIREAAKGDDLPAVVKIAKATNPNSLAEIDALVTGLKQEADAAREAKLARAGLFDAWSGSGQLGFSRTTGNTDDMGIVVGLDLMKDGLRLRHKLHGMVDRQTTGGILTRNKYLAGYELDYKFNQRFYAYGSGAWDKDTFAGIERRFSESVGLGYSVLKSDTMTLDLSAGPAFRQTRYTAAPDENVTTARVGADFGWHVLENLTLSQHAEIFFGSEIKSTTALTASVSKALSARLSFDVTRQNKVPPGRDKLDTATRATLVYGF